MDAGFLNVVEIGQNFMRKDTAEFSQFRAVTCREYTLCQETKVLLNRKVGSEGAPKLGPCWKVATCCLHIKYGVEIRISSVNKDNSHSWVRISMTQTSLLRICTIMSRKSQKCSSKNMR